MKTCSRCHAKLPLVKFGKNRPECRPCRAVLGHAYYAANRATMKANAAAWRAANPELVNAYKAAWRAANPGKAKAAVYAYRGRHPLSVTWASMKQRCANPLNPKYKDYGGRGIAVCDRWLGKDGFSNFVSDMGERPPKHSIDRIDNDGSYEPSNCRWATAKEQAQNQRPRMVVATA